MYRTLQSSGAFDKNWYRSQLESHERFFDPIWHYLRRGWSRGLDPSPLFDTDFYVSWNKDVRLAGVNPFDHYLRYGQSEGRPPVLPLAGWNPPRLNALEPIKFYDSVPEKPQRLSVVFDANTPNRWPGDPAVLLLSAAWVAHGLGRSLRVITREGAPALPDLQTEEFVWPVGLPKPPVTRVPSGREYSDIEKQPDEVFIATSWSSALALHQLLGGSKLVYTVLTNEPDSLPAGEARALATHALNLDGVTYIVAPEDIAANSDFVNPTQTTIVDPAALRLSSYWSPRVAAPKDGVLMVWAGSNLDASHTKTALSGIEKAIQENKIDPEKTPIQVAGELDYALLLLGTFQAHPYPCRSLADIATMVGEARVIIAIGSGGGKHPLAVFAEDLGVPSVSRSGTADKDSIACELGRLVENSTKRSESAPLSRTHLALESFAKTVANKVRQS